MQPKTGILLRFVGDGVSCAIQVEREPDNRGAYLVEHELARALVERFGVAQEDGCIDMSATLGRKVEYIEDEFGYVTQLVVQDGES